MDLALPEMDGVETAKRIHNVPKLSETPIFVVSAYVTEEVKAAAIAAGCTEIFTKPIDVTDLLERIKEVLAFRYPPPL
jgi:CheY-like chemotaxis protein